MTAVVHVRPPGLWSEWSSYEKNVGRRYRTIPEAGSFAIIVDAFWFEDATGLAGHLGRREGLVPPLRPIDEAEA